MKRLSPYTPSYLPSEGSSPRRRGAAEGTGAELSMRYQKVSVIGIANKNPGGTVNENQPLGVVDRAKGIPQPFLKTPPDSFSLQSNLQGWWRGEVDHTCRQGDNVL